MSVDCYTLSRKLLTPALPRCKCLHKLQESSPETVGWNECKTKMNPNPPCKVLNEICVFFCCRGKVDLVHINGFAVYLKARSLEIFCGEDFCLNVNCSWTDMHILFPEMQTLKVEQAIAGWVFVLNLYMMTAVYLCSSLLCTNFPLQTSYTDWASTETKERLVVL